MMERHVAVWIHRINNHISLRTKFVNWDSEFNDSSATPDRDTTMFLFQITLSRPDRLSIESTIQFPNSSDSEGYDNESLACNRVHKLYFLCI